jgi:DNA-binding GntR family transcriptional regulator
MPTKTVNSHPLAAAQVPGVRPATRYSTVARLLTEEIEGGRYQVGEKIPTEAQLQERFDVSRHTVREALRDLKSQGLILARAGVGTVVRARAPRTRFMQGVGTLQELIQFVEATRMRVLARRRTIVDPVLAERVALKTGQQWHEALVLRFLPNEPTPVASMRIFVRPEHGDVLDHIDTAGLPVFNLIERRYGIRIDEVSQQIVAVLLEREAAHALKARVDSPALEITRRYTDAADRIVMASVGLYPSDRFSHTTKFRLQSSEERPAR